MADATEARDIIAQTLSGATPDELLPGEIYGYKFDDHVEMVDLTGDQYRDLPRRKTGKVIVRDAESFLAYFAKHSDGESELYANTDLFTVTAVLDAHTGTTARWGEHRLNLQLQHTPEWEAWSRLSGKLTGQAALAEHFEANLPDILEPNGATMLEIAQTFQATTKAEFVSSTRLSTGERKFTFNEEHQATAGGKGELVIPETMVIALAPFKGGKTYKVKARFRYQLRAGELAIGYTLDRPHDVLDLAFSEVLDEIGGSEAVFQPILRGTPA